MTPDFIIKFAEELKKYMGPGKLTYETKDNHHFNFHWKSGNFQYDFPMGVPINYEHSVFVAQNIGANIAWEQLNFIGDNNENY